MSEQPFLTARFGRTGLSVLLGAFLCAAGGMLPARGATEYFPFFNARVGTQTFNPQYGFTTQTRLVETAEAIWEMGSDVVKFTLATNVFETYDLPPLQGISSLTELARDEPSFRHVFDMPFPYTMVWAYPVTVANAYHHPWRRGFLPGEAEAEYAELYDFARYLLRTYSGSGRTFLLGHWEGDWALLGEFDPDLTPTGTAIQGMIDWLNLRQRAVDQARADEPHTNVFIWQYAEVNLVQKAMTGGVTVANNVLPYCTNDLVSYSAYDTIQSHPISDVTNALEYIRSKAHTTGHFPRDIFIGEYGRPGDGIEGTPGEQADLVTNMVKTAAGWGCPFVLYWQMYNNETNAAGGQRGFWLINDLNEPVPAYVSHRDFLGKAHAFKNLYRFWLRRNPDEPAFSSLASDTGAFQPSSLVGQMLASAEFSALAPDEAYLLFLFEHLLAATATADPDFQSLLAQLQGGATRVEVLDALLDGPRFAARCGNEQFAGMLLGGTLQRTQVRSDDADLLDLVVRLGGGEARSDLWREFLDRPEYAEAELGLRWINEVGSHTVLGKCFFSYDLDEDGMPDAWEKQIIDAEPDAAPFTIEEVTAEGDADGDGLSNGQESAFGTDPLAADSDDDGLSDGVEVDDAAAFSDSLDTTAHLTPLLNTRVEMNGDGTVTFLRTNSSPDYTEAIVDWQRGGAEGAYFSITATPIVIVDPVHSVRDGSWSIQVQLFDAAGQYLGEPTWVPDGQTVQRVFGDVAALAQANGYGAATQYRLRFRLGAYDNGGVEPGFVFTRMTVLAPGNTDPADADTDGDRTDDQAEALAGTNPLDAGDVFQVGSLRLGETGETVLSWWSKSGRVYQVLAGSSPGGTDTVADVAGAGGLQSYTNEPGAGSHGFFRLSL